LLGFEAEAYANGWPKWLDEARDLWQQWIGDLADPIDGSAGYGRIGTLRLLTGLAELEVARGRLADRSRPCHVMTRDDLAEAGLQVIPDAVQGALFFPLDARVDPRRLGQLLSASLRTAGVEVHEETPIVELLTAGNHVVGVKSAKGKTAGADCIVLAAGSQSAELLAHKGLYLPLRAVRGQAVAVQKPEWWPSFTIQSEDWYAIPRDDDSLVVGSTWEEDVTTAQATWGGIEQIGGRIFPWFPALRDASWLSAWAGIRPVSPDDLPYIGSLVNLPGLLLAAGHGPIGVMLAPWTASVIVALAEGRAKPEWEQFSPARAVSKIS
jgi:glycine oxidase